MNQLELQDKDWERDWKTIVNIFDTIEHLEHLFGDLDVPYLREIQQKVLLLNLEKYAWSTKLHRREIFSSVIL